MLSQHQVNEACQMLKRDGQEITISKVRKLLRSSDSFFNIDTSHFLKCLY